MTSGVSTYPYRMPESHRLALESVRGPRQTLLTDADRVLIIVSYLRQVCLQKVLVDLLSTNRSPSAGPLGNPDSHGRVRTLPGCWPYRLELVRSLRIQPGGFWMASTVPEAAYEAPSGSVELATVTGALLATDGVIRLVEWYGQSWEQIVSAAAAAGSGALIALVRQ
ncbi:hypothetical protein [Streptosporangium sp. KLBMP 9127]|nr:hypothetical protein [Streptosporangium sp. KLBMP 9127]